MRSEFEHLEDCATDPDMARGFSIGPVNEAGHSEAVVRLFSQHQRWLYGYLMSLLGNANDAEDVMQEVSVVLWKDHHKFELGTNFTAWLSVIAYHQVQKFWRQRKRNRMFLSTNVLEQIAALPDDFELMESRRRALSDCVGKLREMDRTLVRQFYGERKVTAKQLAQELGRPTGTVYKALNRVRRGLFECVRRKMQAEGTA